MSVRDLIPWGRSSQTPSLYRDDDRNPFVSLHREMNRLFDDVFRGFDSRLPSFGTLSTFNGGWPSVEISETDKDLRVTAEVPGLDQNDIEVLLDDDVLTLRGEKRSETEDAQKQFSERYYEPRPYWELGPRRTARLRMLMAQGRQVRFSPIWQNAANATGRGATQRPSWSLGVGRRSRCSRDDGLPSRPALGVEARDSGGRLVLPAAAAGVTAGTIPPAPGARSAFEAAASEARTYWCSSDPSKAQNRIG